MYSSPVTLADGETHSFAERIFAGPKLQDALAEVAPGLELTVDYGWLTVVSQPLFWLLEKLHDLLGNWGWAIIFLTILIKLAFYKLSETSYKSMANMRRMTPRLQALKDRYGSDKQRLNQAMMELYKKEKINPLGGCLPVVVQIPVFIALYWVLLESVELRQAPFILWMNNLSAPDPYFVLAAGHGHFHVHPAEAQSRSGGPHAGQDHDGPTGGIHSLLRLLPLRVGALLGGQQHPVHCPAVVHHP